MPRPNLLALSLSLLCLTGAPLAHAQDSGPQDNNLKVGATAPSAKAKAGGAMTQKESLALSHKGPPLPMPPPRPDTGAPAEPLQPSSPWSGGGELGFASAHGNSSTESLNARLDLNYADGGAWKYSGSLSGLRASSEYKSTQPDGSVKRDRRTTANRYTLTGNGAYRTDSRGTVNTSLRHEEDDFGTFSRQTSVSVSYGNRVVDGDRTQLDLQVGPGFRRAYDTLEERNESSVIGRGLVDLRVSLSENTELVNKLLVESGEYNTFAQNDLGLSVTMNSHLALKAGWQARHNSDAAENLKRTDTLTTMNVVYKFK